MAIPKIKKWLPKSVKIGPHTIKIVYEKTKKDYIGIYIADDNLIALRKKMPLSKLKETLLHEIMHSFDENYLMKLGEERVNNLALYIYQFIKENPKIVRWLLNG